MIKENFIKLYENSFKENWDLPCYTDYGEDNAFYVWTSGRRNSQVTPAVSTLQSPTR